MRATFTQEQLEIAKTVRAIAEAEAVTARDALAGPWRAPGCDATLLRDFGLLGVPEPAGGVGSGLIDLLVAVETLGALLLPSRFPAHAAAVQLLSGGGPLPADVLEGARVLAPALDAPGATGWADRIEPDSQEPDHFVRTLVPYAEQADGFA